MLLTLEINEKVYLARLLKNLFDLDGLSNAFKYELSEVLHSIDENELIPDLITFYKDHLVTKETEIKKIKFNNKIIHQSKLLNYFAEKRYIQNRKEPTIY